MGRSVNHWEAYRGALTKIIVCIDIGTTNSGASYCLLEPGKAPKVYDTGTYPHAPRGSYKAPSLVAFDRTGKCVAIGSEVQHYFITHGDDVHVAKWWKLALTTDHIATNVDVSRHIDIPPNISAQEVFIKYIKWIFQCVEKDITTRYKDGPEILAKTKASRELILTHPNTWDGRAHSAMRKAAVQAGIVDEGMAESSIRFLTEAEASLTYAVLHSSLQAWIKPKQNLVVADLGGGTCDISSYEIVETNPTLEIRESAPAQCVVAGATTVEARAKSLVSERLRGSEWDGQGNLDWIGQKLWDTIVSHFHQPDNHVWIHLGQARHTDELRGIKDGKICFGSDELAALFEPSIQAVAKALKEALKGSASLEHKVVLVGGFAENHYVRRRLASIMGETVSLIKADNVLSKAVANGGCSWAIQSVISQRMSTASYGVRCAIPYDRSKPEHQERRQYSAMHSDGVSRLPNAYLELLPAVSIENALGFISTSNTDAEQSI
ncbi:hypothetical protein CF327_g5884 [Tilletia walkeri]|uniref:Uncharacterized protein n=1 Tax=Tilletia walkeri TaxID=117179 RepID=A0A8X7T3X3_9BASI|nr:hypothetical protein CF327_g5884 [Tilletia walkeri]KAE8267509.1 hypothetical protein A4X09_0g4836 [Tilletia walkeri]